MEDPMRDPSVALVVYQSDALAAQEAIRSFKSRDGQGYEILSKLRRGKTSIKKAAEDICKLIAGKRITNPKRRRKPLPRRGVGEGIQPRYSRI